MSIKKSRNQFLFFFQPLHQRDFAQLECIFGEFLNKSKYSGQTRFFEDVKDPIFSRERINEKSNDLPFWSTAFRTVSRSSSRFINENIL